MGYQKGSVTPKASEGRYNQNPPPDLQLKSLGFGKMLPHLNLTVLYMYTEGGLTA